MGSAQHFDGDGSAHLIFAVSGPLSGPPYNTDIKVRYRDQLLTIAHSFDSPPEPVHRERATEAAPAGRPVARHSPTT
jgi:hypothetical protein